MSAEPTTSSPVDRCPSYSVALGLLCEGRKGHAGPHGWGDERWTAPEWDRPAVEPEPVQLDPLQQHIGHRVSISVSDATSVSGQLVGVVYRGPWDPIMLVIHPPEGSDRPLLVPWHAVRTVLPRP